MCNGGAISSRWGGQRWSHGGTAPGELGGSISVMAPVGNNDVKSSAVPGALWKNVIGQTESASWSTKLCWLIRDLHWVFCIGWHGRWHGRWLISDIGHWQSRVSCMILICKNWIVCTVTAVTSLFVQETYEAKKPKAQGDRLRALSLSCTVNYDRSHWRQRHQLKS